MSVFTSFGTGGSSSGTVTLTGATAPVITRFSLTLAATEYSHILPTNCRQFLIKAYDAEIQFSYVSGQSGTDYMTITRNNFYGESELMLLPGTTIYLQSPVASQIIEILTWI